jgi:hypothetical protein
MGLWQERTKLTATACKIVPRRAFTDMLVKMPEKLTEKQNEVATTLKVENALA